MLDKALHPSLNTVLPELLQQTFPQLATGVGIETLYVNRYRTDRSDIRYFESSRPLTRALSDLLGWENSSEEVAVENGVEEGVFHSPTAFNKAEQVAQEGSLMGLADSIQTRLPAQISAFWRTPVAAGLTCPQARLTDIHRQCLAAQAQLRSADQTLSPLARLLIDRVMQYPSQAQREDVFRHGSRPGVYQLRVENGTPEGERLATSFILTPSDGAWTTTPHWPSGHKNVSTNGVGGSVVHGPVVLYTPGKGFEEFPLLESLHQTLVARINGGTEDGRLLGNGLPLLVALTKTGMWGDDLRSTFVPIAGDFVVDCVQALLDKQQHDIETQLGLGVDFMEQDSNALAELAEQLDMAAAFWVRNQLLLENSRQDWERQLSSADQTTLKTYAKAALIEEQALVNLWRAIPTLQGYAKEKVLNKIQDFLIRQWPEGHAEADASSQRIDPDKVIVTRVTAVRLNQSGFGMLHEGLEPVERMSLTDLTLKNNKPWERSLSWTATDSMGATLTNAAGTPVRDHQGKPLTLTKDVLEQWVKDINVGPSYITDVLKKKLDPDTTTGEPYILKAAWSRTQAAALRYAAALARLSPDAYHSSLPTDGTKKLGAAWVAAVIAAPDATLRNGVAGKAVVANALMFNPDNVPGGLPEQRVNGVLVISTDEHQEVILYTPNAPDGMAFREVKSESEMARLLRATAWQVYLKERLPAGTRLLNMQLAPHTGNVLDGMYRQNFLYLIEQTDAQTISNAELQRQSTFNSVMFGIEVATAVITMFPWATHQTASALGWLGKIALRSAQTLRHLGQKIPGLITRQGIAGRLVIKVATETAARAGETTSIGIKPLRVASVARPLTGASAGTPMSQTASATLHNAFRQQRRNLAFAGGVPSGSSLSEGTGIYRAPGGELLIRHVSEMGDEVVYRIQNSFNLYGKTGLVAKVLTPSGASTSFKLRRLPNKTWTLDTLERLPGGKPEKVSAELLQEWQTAVTLSPALKPHNFFLTRGITYQTWAKLVSAKNGRLTTLGLQRLNPGGFKKFTDELFLEWVEMQEFNEAAATAFRNEHRIKLLIWNQYLDAKGVPNAMGLEKLARLKKPTKKITDALLLEWKALAQQPGYQNRLAVESFAREHDLYLNSWLKYVANDGSFRLTPSTLNRFQRLQLIPGPSQPRVID
ncbi:DUF6543 domain-containing protein [Pseudomonas sp. Dout3]|uniref:dermonecrotic toxin domain-containing protein n=1 Tax=Pseudomonas sp. Dout3 TaxID=3048623 RepID=UPI002B23C73A|nr:DUF6543 domain-containing protein [Pseudomonas sp. Dout3]MEB0046630.1 hypothetical protein [Pseudomonas sp. Dout3]